MERQKANTLSTTKVSENGLQRKPPYSVETPYGFRLDLDFLKYVDDIEKGNTIRRVPIQRRSKGPRANTLPRHLNLSSGYGYRPSPWGSTGALEPLSRHSDAHHSGCASWMCDPRKAPVSPTGFRSLAEMEARIKAFDMQPLGEHVRPSLLRASSLPLTVLLRQCSESTEDPGSLRGSRDRIGDDAASSCEDVCQSPVSSAADVVPRHNEFSGLLRRLTEALERVGELEMEVRVIPELRAHICILQEEKERLRLGLSVRPAALYPRVATDVKRPRHDSYGAGEDRRAPPTHEWRTSTDLDELLTVTSLQAKVAVLEQRLHENGLELQRAAALLGEQREESRRKDETIERLSGNPGVRALAERVVVDQGDGCGQRESPQCSHASGLIVPSNAKTALTNGRRGQGDTAVEASSAGAPAPMVLGEAPTESADPEAAAYHVAQIRRLLQQQWECLCGGPAHPEHPDAKINALQKEMMGLVDILSACYRQHRCSDGEGSQHGALKSIMKRDESSRATRNLHFAGGNEGCGTAASLATVGVNQGVLLHASTQGGSDPPGRWANNVKESQAGQGQQTKRSEARPSATDGGAVSVEVWEPAVVETVGVTEPKPPGGPRVDSEQAREIVSGEFLSACQFLEDHMDKMDNPNDEMRRALVVLFQDWFSVAAEETSMASKVAVYLREVKRATPSLLAFLVNLADDNGNTALHYSVSYCNYAIVSLLLDTGISEANLQNKAGYTAVMLAALTAPDRPGDMEVVRRLMELGNVNSRSHQTGQTALQLAVKHGRVVMVRLLLSRGADVDTQDAQGATALMWACERGRTHIARLLLERGPCNLALTDKRGRTALSLALQGSHTDTATLLQAHAKARAL